jgi:hypothetical protein
MQPLGPETKSDCTAEGQQRIKRQTPRQDCYRMRYMTQSESCDRNSWEWVLQGLKPKLTVLTLQISPDQTRTVTQFSHSCPTKKYGHGFCGAWIQEYPCWQTPQKMTTPDYTIPGWAVKDKSCWGWKQYRESPLLKAVSKWWVHEDTPDWKDLQYAVITCTLSRIVNVLLIICSYE